MLRIGTDEDVAVRGSSGPHAEGSRTTISNDPLYVIGYAKLAMPTAACGLFVHEGGRKLQAVEPSPTR